MAFARVVLPSTVTTTRNNLLVGRRTRSKNDGRRHPQNRAFSKASLKSDENDEPIIITTIAGKAVAAVVATAVALSAPTRASAEEVVRFLLYYAVFWFCSRARARTRELFPGFSGEERVSKRRVSLSLSVRARARPRSRPLYHTARVTRERLTVRTRTFLSVSDDKRSD